MLHSHYSNHVGNHRWTSALKWSGHDAFNKEELREWEVNEEIAGQTQSANGLTFATINGAGHMVGPSFHRIDGPGPLPTRQMRHTIFYHVLKYCLIFNIGTV